MPEWRSSLTDQGFTEWVWQLSKQSGGLFHYQLHCSDRCVCGTARLSHLDRPWSLGDDILSSVSYYIVFLLLSVSTRALRVLGCRTLLLGLIWIGQVTLLLACPPVCMLIIVWKKVIVPPKPRSAKSQVRWRRINSLAFPRWEWQAISGRCEAFLPMEAVRGVFIVVR